ncbi:bifunctional biotin--[acetyl-CoA-carboxylase] ligase/biotin operon repressor BirA [Marinimicrobium sp. C2-29]|uniref:bifunctional biotin--[acetyl-CoA-carboxylase] ligase/biotin operon repressor BirA n=1 Tax=Marinimicrobium sp. C2-29 TaxID=3139825 RepID=UPI0031392743
MTQADTPKDPLSALLVCLADGDFHSGDELGESLGMSRAAVWKHLQKLTELGLPLTSIRGRGYQVEGGLELLEKERILGALDPEARRRLNVLELFRATDSTNVRALARGPAEPSGYVCLAEQQTAGRGRRGRAWVSPYGRNLYLSASWNFDGGAAALEGLSLAVGVAICRALEASGLQGVRLKWPNDLLWRGRKLAGVLLEMTGDPVGQCRVVVGIGINLSMPAGAARGIDQPWVDVSEACREEGLAPLSRNRLAAELINQLLPLLADYQRSGFSDYRNAWHARDAFLGQTVVLKSAQREQLGVARGVDGSGALRLEVDGQEQLCHGGELSMRAVS